MGKNVKLNSTRGLIAILLTLTLMLCIFFKDKETFISYTPVYMLILNYMFGKDDNNTGDNIK